MAGNAVPVVVDLTLSDTSSSDDISMADLSALRALAQKAPSRFQNGGGSGFSPARQSETSLEVHLPARTAAPPGKVNTTRGPSPGPSATTTAITTTSSRVDTTPSRTGRTSILDEIRDSQSPTPPFQTPPIPRALSPPLHRFPNSHQTPKQPSMTPRQPEWTVDKIVTALGALAVQVGQNHARLVEYELEEAEKKAPEPRHITSFDDFADMKHIALEHGTRPPPGVATMAIKFKQHSGEHSNKSKTHGKRVEFPTVAIRTDKESVPRYRFHHVEIKKNILAPNSMLNFVPHLRDVDPNSADEKKYAAWLAELERLDSLSGFNPLSRGQKVIRRAQNEYAATLSMYLDAWLKKLDIDGCTKNNLIRYMASESPKDDAITPQQKSHLLDTYNSVKSPQSLEAARRFTEAFDQFFNDEKNDRRITLSDVLKLDKAVEPILDNKRAKDTPTAQRHQSKELMQKVVDSLGSYSTLGCLICFSHDCAHGEIDWENQKRCFSLEEVGGLAPALKAKWAAQVKNQESNAQQNSFMANKPTHQPCRNQCYRTQDAGSTGQMADPWMKSEVATLEHVFATIGYSSSLKPQCFVAAVLGRPCWDVNRKFEQLGLTLPPVEPREATRPPKQLSWYDRKKKQLLGDWQDATVSHEHAMREIFPPCSHEGPCTAANECPCAIRGSHPVLCERFCLCTAEECAMKFTGCACHSLGKTCLQRQKEGRPCICVQLNRECDPVLCRGCGARERADPENAFDDQLHSTGCQNVPLQRGATKAVVIGQSRLEGCGYGLFTAEDIAQDEFIIEYTGELISHDEGVRRENRRGDVFDEENKISYLFTLLEQEGIWVDAAIYGNLSRYINHSQEYPNITPKIVYVNHEWRIKFSALRDIKAGTELFFNYGDNFPNLTKKLVESRENNTADGNGTAAQKRKVPAARGTARKTTSKSMDLRASDEDMMLDYDGEVNEWGRPLKRTKKTRGGRRVGAGRKPKNYVPDDATSNTSNQNNQAAEVSDSQAESLETPTRRRVERKSYISLLKPGTSEAGTTPDGVKKVSKRGGARPGAGRKPKHRPGMPPKAGGTSKNGSNGSNSVNGSNSNSEGGGTASPNSTSEKSNNLQGNPMTNSVDFDSDDVSIDPRHHHLDHGPEVSSLANSESAAAGRKRKASELEMDDSIGEGGNTVRGSLMNKIGASISGTTGPYKHAVFQPIEDDLSMRSRDIGGEDGDGEEEEDDDMVSHTRRRQTQKPWRYRNAAE